MYQCLSSDFSKVEKRIQSAIRLINKYGYSANFEVIGKEVKYVPLYVIDSVTKTKSKKNDILAEVVNYTFEMPDFKVGNYIPVAVIEHDVVDNDSITNMVHVIDNSISIPTNWWTIKGHCDDCNDSYNRKKTVMLLNTDDKSFRQIGTSCLKKYLGINIFNVIGNFMSVSEILEQEVCVYDDEFHGLENKYRKTREYLAAVVDEIAENGYDKFFTASKAMKTETYSKDSLAKADKIIDFFKNIDVEDEIFQNNFYMNVRTVVISEYAKQSGFIAYAPLAYEKCKQIIDNRKYREEVKQSSQYIGNVGDKIIAEVKVMSCIAIDTQFGTSYLNVFIEKDTNNVLTWFTATKSFEVGTELSIQGKVKEHKEYKDEKQTVLTRVKVY